MNTTLPQGFAEKNNVIYGLTPEGLFHIKMQRPEKKNATTIDMLLFMATLLKKAEFNDEVKVVLVYGAGGHFSAGNDIMSMMEQENPNPNFIANKFIQFMRFPKPIVFFVTGCCLGVAATLSASADFVYCSETAFFQTPFMTLNLSPEGASTLKLPELVGRRKANEMIFLEQRLPAKEAFQLGYVNSIILNDKLPSVDPIITDIEKIPGLKKLLSLDSRTVQNTKKLLLAAQDVDKLLKLNQLEQQTFVEAVQSDLFKDTVQKMIAAMWKQAQQRNERPKL